MASLSSLRKSLENTTRKRCHTGVDQLLPPSFPLSWFTLVLLYLWKYWNASILVGKEPLPYTSWIPTTTPEPGLSLGCAAPPWAPHHPITLWHLAKQGTPKTLIQRYGCCVRSVFESIQWLNILNVTLNCFSLSHYRDSSPVNSSLIEECSIK